MRKAFVWALELFSRVATHSTTRHCRAASLSLSRSLSRRSSRCVRNAASSRCNLDEISTTSSLSVGIGAASFAAAAIASLVSLSLISSSVAKRKEPPSTSSQIQVCMVLGGAGLIIRRHRGHGVTRPLSRLSSYHRSIQSI